MWGVFHDNSGNFIKGFRLNLGRIQRIDVAEAEALQKGLQIAHEIKYLNILSDYLNVVNLANREGSANIKCHLYNPL